MCDLVLPSKHVSDTETTPRTQSPTYALMTAMKGYTYRHRELQLLATLLNKTHAQRVLKCLCIIQNLFYF